MKDEKTDLFDPVTGAELMNVTQTAAYLGYEEASIWRLKAKGTLKEFKKVGKTLLFLKTDLDRFRETNPWAARKAGIERSLIADNKPNEKLTASIKADLATGTVIKPELKFIEDFFWEQLPLIKARVIEKFGHIRFDVEIKSPDGGEWTIHYEPPGIIERIKKYMKGGGK